MTDNPSFLPYTDSSSEGNISSIGTRGMPREFLQLIVLRMPALGFGHRILGRVLYHLGVNGLRQVNAEVVSQLKQINRDIGQLIRELILVLRRVPVNFLRGFPLEMFQHLGGLQHQRQRDVLVIMKLLPLAFVAEGFDFLGNVFDSAHKEICIK